MESAEKIKNDLVLYVGNEVDALNHWRAPRRQTLIGLQPASSKLELPGVELTLAAQLMKAKAQLQRETTKRKQAEKKLRACRNDVRALTSELVMTEERERHRLAQDLHDTVAQCLAACRFKLESLQSIKDPGSRSEQAGDCLDCIDQAIKQTRLLMFGFYPWSLHESGLGTTLRSLAHRIHEVHGIHVEYLGDGIADALDKDLSVLLFRTIRELVSNVVKHAKAQHVTIAVSRLKKQIRVEVVDDGIGFDMAGPAAEQEMQNAFGLFSIRERLGRLGGRLDLKSHPGQGTQVAVVVPGQWNQAVN